MPYKVSGQTVKVQRNGKWVTLKKHTSKEKALKHLAALKINVKE